jgi:hypothetical protein
VENRAGGGGAGRNGRAHLRAMLGLLALAAMLTGIVGAAICTRFLVATRERLRTPDS